MTTRQHPALIPAVLIAIFAAGTAIGQDGTVKPKDDGYRGIWYANQPSDDVYRFKYSGGLGTYTAKHIPIAYHAPEVDRTFFVWGGTRAGENNLLQMVSYYDHASGTVPRPTILMDKKTDDAHDNPTIMLDDDGRVWVFVSAHGTARPSYIYRSVRPYDVDAFELISETNFSYPQPWWIPGRGFLFLHTRYAGGRFLYWMTSPDGVTWSEPHQLAAVEQGHYQVSGVNGGVIGTAFNYHPDTLHSNWSDPEADRGDNARLNGLNYRTNLYYLQSDDYGATWRTASGETVETPLTRTDNPALVHGYEEDGLLCYMKDLAFDSDGRPVILFITSRGFEAGPKNGPRTWTTARWDGSEWVIFPVTVSDNNYDMGSLYIMPDGTWMVIGPTEQGPQRYNPGGEVALWLSGDMGVTWERERLLTNDSRYNHTYVRRPVNAVPGFMAFWADGNARELSPSRLYFYNRDADTVYRLPERMTGDTARPEPVR